MTIVLYILSALTSLLVLVVVVASLRPSEFRYSRSLAMAAPAARVFAEVSDLQRWKAWSPYAVLDAHQRQTYSGSPSGPGARMAWNGNSKVGAGSMEIVSAAAPTRLELELHFLRPFHAQHQAVFSFDQTADTTTVTWTMTGTNPLLSKVVGLFMNLEALVCADFERGLASLKTLTEAEPR